MCCVLICILHFVFYVSISVSCAYCICNLLYSCMFIFVGFIWSAAISDKTGPLRPTWAAGRTVVLDRDGHTSSPSGEGLSLSDGDSPTRRPGHGGCPYRIGTAHPRPGRRAGGCPYRIGTAPPGGPARVAVPIG